MVEESAEMVERCIENVKVFYLVTPDSLSTLRSSERNTNLANIYLFEVSPELLPFVSVDEYDGMETPHVNYQKAKVHFLDVFVKKVEADKDQLEGAYAELKDALELLKKK